MIEEWRSAIDSAPPATSLAQALWFRLACLALAGALGALARLGITTFCGATLGGRSYWGTLAVNLLGCLVFGLLVEALPTREPWGPFWRVTLLTGFLGALTTYSAFAFDTTALAKEATWNSLVSAAAYVAAHLFFGTTALVLGRLISRSISTA